MEDRLLEDYKKAMKDNNEIDKATIQFLRAQILKAKKDKQMTLTDQEIENVIMQDRKKRYEALALYEKGNRPDLVEQTYKEIAVVNRYLPQPLSQEELENEIKNIISEVGTDKSMFGKIMATAKAKIGNRADGKVISDTIKKLLEV